MYGTRAVNCLIGKKGFTLLEVLVAFVLLATAVTVILQLFSSSLKVLSRSEDFVHAAVMADAKMREALYNPELAEKEWVETTAEGYTISMDVKKVFENRTDGLPVVILQVGLVISWKRGEKEEFTLTDIF